MDGSVARPSLQLLAANRRLHELRTQAQAQRQAAGAWERPAGQGGGNPPWDAVDPFRVASPDSAAAALPAHLGWESAPVTAVIRKYGPQASICAEDARKWRERLFRGGPEETAVVRPFSTTAALLASPNSPHLATRSSHAGGWVKLYPDIGLGMLRQEMTASGRLWEMLRYLDHTGSGKFRVVKIQQTLTQNSSTLRICGKRQLRNLLRDGEGIFWTRDKEFVWLRSAARVAYALGVEHLTGRPVALPVTALLDGVGTFRAHLYAAFHSGRTKETPHGTQVANRYSSPIARDTLAGLSGVGQSSQRAYETIAGIKVQANFAVGEVAREENRENRAWTKGQALFELKDYRGEQGKKGKSYLAWQLPNTYIGRHQKRPGGRQKRINRKLKDLVMKGMPGNVEGAIETQKPEKAYFPNGKLAAKAYGRDPKRELYWKRHRTGNGRFVLWQQLGRGQC